MDAIKLLDSLEKGMPLVVTTNWQGLTMRKVSIYGGTDEMGKYTFIDDSGIYQLTTGYIKEHVTLQTELDDDEDIWKLSKLLKKLEG